MNPEPPNAVSPKTIEQVYQPMTRRTFLRGSAAAVAGMAGLALALKPLLELERGELTLADLLQRHYRELTPADLDRIMATLAAKLEHEYGVRPHLRDLKPLDGVEFGYALNLTRCIGCRKCAHACLRENNQSRSDPDDIEMSYIRVLELKKGAINLETSTAYYDPLNVPQADRYYMPVQCHQCRAAPCTKVCPVKATWQEEDGLVVVDYNWCIGCRYCMAACPYDARRFNYHKPTLAAAAINPDQSYLSNRLRPGGVVEKCTYCLHRTRAGKYPACLEVCPTGARVFGNLRDPNSEMNYILKNKRVYVLKEDVGTLPRFYYFFDR
jgi:molybdopterin-containing oxidoreductase family iron-sulfur binding subunit